MTAKRTEKLGSEAVVTRPLQTLCFPALQHNHFRPSRMLRLQQFAALFAAVLRQPQGFKHCRCSRAALFVLLQLVATRLRLRLRRRSVYRSRTWFSFVCSLDPKRVPKQGLENQGVINPDGNSGFGGYLRDRRNWASSLVQGAVDAASLLGLCGVHAGTEERLPQFATNLGNNSAN